jgi:hypothetical protein
MSIDAAAFAAALSSTREIYIIVYILKNILKKYSEDIMHRELGERFCFGIRPKMSLICFIKVNNI